VEEFQNQQHNLQLRMQESSSEKKPAEANYLFRQEK
jgi:hypothetical protein